METNLKAVKSLYTEKFGIVLMETPVGKYFIQYASNIEVKRSEMLDLNTALHFFDIKLNELKGQA